MDLRDFRLPPQLICYLRFLGDFASAYNCSFVPTFWDNLSVLSARVNCLILADGTDRLSRNDDTKLQSYAAQNPKRVQIICVFSTIKVMS